MKPNIGIIFLSALALIVSLFTLLQTNKAMDLQADEIVALKTEIRRMDESIEILRPIVSVMAAANVGDNFPEAYMPVQATGVPNSVTLNGDDPLAWCPGSENEGMEWLLLTYAEPVLIAEINIFANFNPGAVVKVNALLEDGSEVSLWEASDEIFETKKQTIPVTAGVVANKIQLTLDTSRVAGWNEIDAVEIVSNEGRRFWAIEAKASSHWEKE